MQTIQTSFERGEPLLRRLRRMGLVLTGDQTLADGILRDAFLRAGAKLSDVNSISERDIFKLGYDAFDDAVHRKGVVVIMNRARTKDGSLGDDVDKLSFIERVAIALLLIENMSLAAAASLCSRPPTVLEDSLKDAMNKLDVSTDDVLLRKEPNA